MSSFQGNLLVSSELIKGGQTNGHDDKIEKRDHEIKRLLYKVRKVV
jgi:hypothetical protein